MTGSTWNGYSPLHVPPVTRLPVATYRATIGLDVEQSELTINPDINREIVVAALTKSPEWCPITWPEIDTQTDLDLRHLALLKIRLFFDFASRLSGETTAEIHEALWTEFPDLRAALDETATATRFKRFPVHATIWSDGTANGGYETVEEGELPPLGVVTWDALDLMIKNLARADIRRLIEENANQPEPLLS